MIMKLAEMPDELDHRIQELESQLGGNGFPAPIPPRRTGASASSIRNQPVVQQLITHPQVSFRYSDRQPIRLT
jgi:hypothetical protein